jgi:putative membrane protein
MISKSALVALSALLAFGTAAASHDGPHISDAQIAHIAYTAGQIDVAAARQALEKSTKSRSAPSPRRWCATMKP